MRRKAERQLSQLNEEGATLSSRVVDAQAKEIDVKKNANSPDPDTSFQERLNAADARVKATLARRKQIKDEIATTDTAKAGLTIKVDISKKRSVDFASAATTARENLDKASDEVKKATEKQEGCVKKMKTAKSMLEFAKLNNLGVKPGVCCQQANKDRNQACLKCRCTDAKALQEANAHCTACKPGHIHLLDVTGAGVCQEWDTLKELYNDQSKVRTACPLHPHQISKFLIPGEGFACYRWGWFKERLLAATNGLNSPVHVRPLCKVMKQTVCSKAGASTSAPTKLSRACSVKKSATCAEVWIEADSFGKYFAALDRVLKEAAAAAQRADQAATAPASSAPATANATALQQAFQGSGGRRLLEDPSAQQAATEKAQQEAKEAQAVEQQKAFVKSKCEALGGTMRTMSRGGKFYCSVGCNPEERVVREMLALEGSKWTTDWRSGNWCEPMAAIL